MSQTRIVVQCRLASQRLAAKALLPVGGMALFELCVRRAGNSGLPTILATSQNETDETLRALAQRCGIDVFAGSELDVLGRFAAVARGWDDNDVVVRLTADNCFPDGAFIHELVAQMRSRSLCYLGTSSPADGLPYGLSAEAFTVAALRHANAEAHEPGEREHVTPWIIARHRVDVFRPASVQTDLSHLRCTIDTLADYMRISRLFLDVEDPVHEAWQALVNRLERATTTMLRPRGNKRTSSLTFGSVQWGLRYGRSNESGIPDADELREIVRSGTDAGISCVDTARAYGNAELRIGQLRASHALAGTTVVTKLDPLAEVNDTWSRDAVRSAVDASVFGSCRDLNQASLDTLLLHRWSHFASHNGAIWQRLLELKRAGVVRALGVSVQAPQEAVEALDIPDISHIQLPFNILDQRWLHVKLQRLLNDRADVVVHARSAFLQGVLISDAAAWPPVAAFDAHKTIETLNALAREFAGGDRKLLCLNYVLSQAWIDSCVVGFETAQQCQQVVKMAQETPFTQAQLVSIQERIGAVPVGVLDPSTWGAST